MSRPQTAAQFRVGIRSAPYLADHGFQDLIVVPGSLYVERALSLERETHGRAACLVRNVTFENPVVLAAEDSIINVEVSEHEAGRVEYRFYEASDDDGAHRPVRPYAARLVVERNASAPSEAGVDPAFIESFQARSHAVIASKRFYEALRENGNQYGDRFQNVASIWRAGDQLLGKLALPRDHRPNGAHVLHPSLLDSMTQLLATFVMDRGRTVVLRSIEQVRITEVDFPETLWAHATLLRGDRGDDDVVGDIRVFDQEGRSYLELSRVSFTVLDRVDVASDRPANVVIASNFTAEPLEESLQFWGAHFGAPFRIEFAPYDQIFQQLLGTGSAFGRNAKGVNVILLTLEEWVTRNRPVALLKFNGEAAEKAFGARARYVLPSGAEIVHLNRYETDYVYKEIFEDQCYLRHGIRLRDGDTIVDIGANIGLFSLFVMSRCRNPRIYAYEPAPLVYDLLKANCEVYGADARAFNLGVSDEPGTAAFTFYEKSSVFSGFHSDESEDRRAIEAIVRDLLAKESVTDADEYVGELTADRLRRITQTCRLTTVSEIIRENRIRSIDLLKVDAEKSELEILHGIEDGDWPKIRQIVIEIHDRSHDAVGRIERLLADRGYRCAIEGESLLERAGFVNLYAVRVRADDETSSGSPDVAAAGNGAAQSRERAASLTRNVEELCDALRTFMSRSRVPLLLCVCPRTPAAKADAELGTLLDDAEEALISQAGRIANVRTIGSASALRRHPVADYYDPHSDHAGHVPYTPECYAAIGTELVRTLFNLGRSPFKVVALDCDNTLWKGVCGEDGPLGIEITPPYRALQEFMLGQANSGMLVCLCSKNNEQDALDVFDQRTDMPLKRKHLVTWRINWNRKSENIKALARELDVGLDSFIFIDDNPVDCADVRINCPGVLALQLPANAELIPAFLKNVWAFDAASATAEDQSRTRMYRENSEREWYRKQSFSLNDFVKGLGLRIEIAEMSADQLARVSQLTFRTNQFNLTTIRRSESEIESFLMRGDAHCLVVSVVDRFGDYGLVGVVLYEAEVDRYKVDTLLLSCRVLGRGVEHALVARLGRRAVDEGKAFVEFTYRATTRNAPAFAFISGIGDEVRDADAASWVFPAARLARIEYDPDKDQPIDHHPAAVHPETHGRRPLLALDSADRSDRLQRIAEDLYDIERLAKAIDEYRAGPQAPDADASALPGNGVETVLVKIWKKVLGRPRIGMNDNFFDVGGTSLRAVQVIAAIKKELKQSLSIASLFECPTVTLLAARLGAPSARAAGPDTIVAAAERGRQRRHHKTLRRSAS